MHELMEASKISDHLIWETRSRSVHRPWDELSGVGIQAPIVALTSCLCGAEHKHELTDDACRKRGMSSDSLSAID